MSKIRAQWRTALEACAGRVDVEHLRTADTDVLRRIASLAQRRDDIDVELNGWVGAAQAARRAWSEIGAMLGVSKQAAQRKHGADARAADPA